MKCSFYLFAWLFEDNRLARNSQAIFHSVLQTKKNPKVTPVWVQKVFQSNLPTPLIKWMGGNGWGSLRQATRHPGWVPSCPLCVPERVNESEKLTSHNLLVQGLGALKRMKKGNGQKEMMTSEQNLRLPSYPGRLERDIKEFQQMWLEDFPSVIQERETWLGQEDTYGQSKENLLVDNRLATLSSCHLPKPKYSFGSKARSGVHGRNSASLWDLGGSIQTCQGSKFLQKEQKKQELNINKMTTQYRGF